MKRFVIFILCNLLTFFTYAGVIPYPGLREKIAHNPESSLLLLDSLEEKGAIPQYGIDYLRALSYRTQSRYYMCMYYDTHALNNPEIQRDSVLTSYTYMLLAESSVASFQLAEAANMITKGKEYAEKANNQLLRANMLQMEGDLYRNMGVLNKSYECLQEAISLLSGISNAEAKFLLSHCMGYLMGYYISDRKPQKAWEVGLQREKLLRSLESRTDVHVLDRHKGFFYSKMAYLSYQVKNPQMAKKYADMFYSTVFSTTSMGQLEINDFLLESGDYHSVLVHSKAYFAELDASDSLNVIYLRTLYQSSKAYNALGKYRDAYDSMMHAYDIRTKMRVNIDRNQIFDLADVTDAVSREYELEKAAYRVQMQHRIIIGLVGIMMFLLLLFGGLWRALSVIKRKNRKMAELILELDDQRNKLMPKYSFPQLEMTVGAGEKKLPEEVDTAAEVNTDTEAETSDTLVPENESLFLKFDQQVKEQRLYLDYQLTRDDYAHLMGVDRNRFATILKLYTSGGNLSVYLNGLRLEYSVCLFRSHPDWPISKVAAESALPSLSTFYRLFKDKYGISPNSFRKTFLKKK